VLRPNGMKPARGDAPSGTTVVSGHPRHAFRLAISSLLLAIVAVPATIFLHEGAHFIALRAAGVRGARFLGAAVTYPQSDRFWRLVALGRRDEARTLYDLGAIGWHVAAGPTSTYAMLLGAFYWIVMRRIRATLLLPFAVAAASRQFLLLPNLLFAFDDPLGAMALRSDEGKLAALGSFSPVSLIVIEVAFTLILLIVIFRAVEKSKRSLPITCSALGVTTGLVLLNAVL
jgi:hypothetical protein